MPRRKLSAYLSRINGRPFLTFSLFGLNYAANDRVDALALINALRSGVVLANRSTCLLLCYDKPAVSGEQEAGARYRAGKSWIRTKLLPLSDSGGPGRCL